MKARLDKLALNVNKATTEMVLNASKLKILSKTAMLMKNKMKGNTSVKDAWVATQV